MVPGTAAEIKLSFAPLVKKAAPTVVNVLTRTPTTQQPALLEDPFFRRFFGDDTPLAPPREREQTSLGSGVIVQPDGLIVTNHHVIAGADEVTVVLWDRREFKAGEVRDDQRTDIAVLRIAVNGKALPFLELADSDALEVGDLILAIGNLFGVGQTVTSGIISALARNNVGIADYNFFIQTDAAINPGNSGGVLVTTVQRGSSAARLGIQPGDIVLTINGNDAGDVAALQRLLRNGTGRWQVTVRRGERVLTASVTG